MKTSNKIFFLVLIITGNFSCIKDIIEPDISKKTVVLLSPQNNDSSTVLTHLFWWDEVEDAIKYNLQIVKPAFTSAQQLLLDSNVVTNKFSVTLQPGTYQWRVKAKNGSSETPYSEIRTLRIDSTANLSNQTVVLVSPDNGDTTNIRTQTFKWIKLYNAKDYRFQILNKSNTTIIDVILTTDSARYKLADGEYIWQVQAQNANSASPFSLRKITIDSTGPAVSTPLLPANLDTVSSPDTLTWSRNTSAIGDSLFIYSDSLISKISYKGYTTATSHIFTALPGDYFWRLRSVDAAGNWSGYSATRKFWIK